MNKITILFTAILACFAFTACDNTPQQEPETGEVSEDYIEPNYIESLQATYKDFARSFREGNTDFVVNTYTSDAKFIYEDDPAAIGHQGIQEAMRGLMDQGAGELDLRMVEVWEGGDILVEEGTYRLLSKENETMDAGDYLILWKKEDGSWKMHRDIFNSNLTEEKQEAGK